MFIIDIIILIVIGIFVIKGLKNGLIIELGTVVALISGIFLSSKLSVYIFSCLSTHQLPSVKFFPQIVFAISFILIIVAVIFFARILTGIAKYVNINWLNKICGLVFGFFKGILIVGGIIFIIFLINSHLHFINEDQETILLTPIYNFFTVFFSGLKSLEVWL